MDLAAYLAAKKTMVDEALARYLPAAREEPAALVASMRYTVFGGGKRLRPILALAAAEAVGGDGQRVLPFACALECIHAYSLIHDDLPAMDDDALRRGRPTNHKVFGEATAILAGDALLSEAFFLMADPDVNKGVPADCLARVVSTVARAVGWRGMVAGQADDLASEGKTVTLATVERIHRRKTGALIRVSVVGGAILVGGTEAQVTALSEYGLRLGLAFQISDDILDVEGEESIVGKDVGSDAGRRKATYPGVVGLAGAKERLAEEVRGALEALRGVGPEAEPLRAIARYVLERRS